MSQHGRATVVVGTAVLALLCAGVLGAISVGERSSRQEIKVAALLTQDVQSPANREDGLALASPLPSAERAADAPSTTTTATRTTTKSAPGTTPTPPTPSNTTPATSLDPPPTPFPVDPGTGNPATVQPYAPGVWRLTHNGITVEARIDPPSPNVGDTVRFTFSAGGAGDYCCDLFLYMGNEQRPLFQSSTPPGPCPLPRSTSGQATYVATGRGPIGFHINANLATSLCTAPPQFVSTNLFAGFVVQPW